MKKYYVILFLVVFLLPMLLLAGAKKEEPAPMEEAEPVAEVGGDEADPWIIEVREGLEKYRGEIIFDGPQGKTPSWDTEP